MTVSARMHAAVDPPKQTLHVAVVVITDVAAAEATVADAVVAKATYIVPNAVIFAMPP